MITKCLPSSEGNVWKYVLTCPGNSMSKDVVTEAVLYRYPTFEKRTVLCISVQSGCPVGCTFCGTGNAFMGNLTANEIVQQVIDIFNDKNIYACNCERLQIMFMSMGEPFLNYENVEGALHQLSFLYPNAELLISTIGPNRPRDFRRFVELSKEIDTIGLQFSIHASMDEDRDKIIPFKNKWSLRQIRDYGIRWCMETGRHPYLNYCITDDFNQTDTDNLMNMFPPTIFNFTFSVVCSADESMKDAGYRDLDKIRAVEEQFIEAGYNTRIFDPAGQDDIGGGCGQLWHIQKWMKEQAKNECVA